MLHRLATQSPVAQEAAQRGGEGTGAGHADAPKLLRDEAPQLVGARREGARIVVRAASQQRSDDSQPADAGVVGEPSRIAHVIIEATQFLFDWIGTARVDRHAGLGERAQQLAQRRSGLMGTALYRRRAVAVRQMLVNEAQNDFVGQIAGA